MDTRSVDATRNTDPPDPDGEVGRKNEITTSNDNKRNELIEKSDSDDKVSESSSDDEKEGQEEYVRDKNGFFITKSNTVNYKVLYENMVTKAVKVESWHNTLVKTLQNKCTKECEVNKVLREKIDSMDEKFRTEFEAAIAEKDTVIQSERSKIAEFRNATAPKVMKMNNNDIFLTKPRKGAKDVPSNECAISGCDNANVDMIKCCMCGNLSCEDCSKVKVAKLRPLMNQCDTLYFTCQCCAILIRDDKDVNVYDVLKEKAKSLTEELDTQEKENGKLQRLLDERESTLHEKETKLVSLEQNAVVVSGPPTTDTNIEELIRKRFDMIDQNIDALITKKLAGILPIPAAISVSTDNKKTFAETVGGNVTDSLTAAFRNSKNQEMVLEQERNKRSANLIIYGISETSEGDPKENDQNFVASLLDKIGVAQRPKQLFRLGKQTEGSTRPVKLVMESDDDKDTIMARLGNLKNAEDDFRKVSIRDDYTLEEREMVREFVKKAEAKNSAENTQEWKVRGTPKKGLRLVKITKRQ